MKNNVQEIKRGLIEDIQKRLNDGAIEPQNAETIIRLINLSPSIQDAQFIHLVGVKYYPTGFHYDCRLEKFDKDSVYYFEKNDKLSIPAKDKNKPIHKLIIGDNYKALLNLLIQYRGQIDVIYIDPPYGKDSMGEFAETNYKNDISRDNLLSMLEFRLQLAKQLLSDTGVIFCSIDDRNQAYVKCLFDDIFKEKQFVTCIPRITKKQRSAQEKHVDVSHDYILCYSNATDFVHSIDRDIDEEIVCTDSIGKYIPGDTKAILAALSQGYSEGGDYDFKYNGKVYKPITKDGTRNRWLWKKERMQAAANLGILVESGNTLREQLYIDKKFDEETNTMTEKNQNLIFHTSDFMVSNSFSNSMGKANLRSLGDDLSKSFDNPKPVELIKQLLKLCSFKDDMIVLDFFAGSGTTGQAVLELNREDGGHRQFVLVQLDETLNEKKASGSEKTTIKNAIKMLTEQKLPLNIASLTNERLRRLLTGKANDGTSNFSWIKNNSPFGDGLDVYNINSVLARELDDGKTAFDVIDETLYGKEKMTVKDKIEWVCNNFKETQGSIESDVEYNNRLSLKKRKGE